MENSETMNRTFTLTPEIISVLNLLTVGQDKPNRSKTMRDLILAEAMRRVEDENASPFARESIAKLLVKIAESKEIEKELVL